MHLLSGMHLLSQASLERRSCTVIALADELYKNQENGTYPQNVNVSTTNSVFLEAKVFLQDYVALFMNSIIDVLISDVLEYLGEQPSDSNRDDTPLNEINNNEHANHIHDASDVPLLHKSIFILASPYLEVFLFAMVIVLAMYFCRRGRGKNIDKRFTAQNNLNAAHLNGKKIRRVLLAHPRCRSAQAGISSKGNAGNSTTYFSHVKEQEEICDDKRSTLEPTVTAVPNSSLFKMHEGLVPCINNEYFNSCKAKGDIVLKLGSQNSKATAARKNSQCFCQFPQKIQKETSTQQHHGYTYASPRRKHTELVKSGNTHTIKVDQSNDSKTRWNGGVATRRLSHILSRTSRPAVPISVRVSTIHDNDTGHDKQKKVGHIVHHPATRKSSEPNHALRSSVYHHLNDNVQPRLDYRLRRSSPGTERRQVKRSKQHTSTHDEQQQSDNLNAQLQVEKSIYKTKVDWPTFFRTREAMRKNCKQKSPKKLQRPTFLSKNKKLSGQKKFKKIRKKLKGKTKERIKLTTGKLEKETRKDSTRIGNCLLHVPEPCRASCVSTHFGQTATLPNQHESYTIRRTATPMLSSLFGQGAFRTCWPQTCNKSSTMVSDVYDDVNTGRHNTKFLVPKTHDSNIETTETIFSSKFNNNTAWNRNKSSMIKCERRQERCVDNMQNRDTVREKMKVTNSNPGFHDPNFETRARFSRTHPFKNIVPTNNETKTINNMSEGCENNECQTIDETSCMQFIASSHEDKEIKRMDSYNSRKRLQFTSLYCLDGVKDKATARVKERLHASNSLIEDNTKISRAYEFKWTASTKNWPRLFNTEQYSECRKTAPYAQEEQTAQDCLQRKTDSRDPREDVVKKHHQNVPECRRDVPQFPLLTRRKQSRLEISSRDTTTGNTQIATRRKNGQLKTNMVTGGISQAVASLVQSETATPHTSQGSGSLWKTSIVREGNVFRLTRNTILPSQPAHDNCRGLYDSKITRARHAFLHQTCMQNDLQSNANELSIRCNTEPKKECSAANKTVHRKDNSRECSKYSGKTNLQRNSQKFNHNIQVANHGFQMNGNEFCWDNKKNSLFSSLKWDSKTCNSSHLQKNDQLSTFDQAFPAEEDRMGGRACNTLNQCNSSMTSTVDEGSVTSSDSVVNEQLLEGQNNGFQSKPATCSNYVKVQGKKPPHSGFRVYECRDHAILPLERAKNSTGADRNRHNRKCRDRQPTDKRISKRKVFRGHAVKKTKSLISLRNMLQELTSQFRRNQENHHYKQSTHIKKPHVKTVLYFQPTRSSSKLLLQDQRQSDRHHDPVYFPPPEGKDIVSSIGTSDSYEGNDKYVKCYRSETRKLHRHVPYRKRSSISKNAIVTPSSSHFWTRNKNNCSPMRKGRYVLLPLVDKQLFDGQVHPLEMDESQATCSTVASRQNRLHQDNTVSVIDSVEQLSPATRRTHNIGHMSRKEVETYHTDTQYIDTERAITVHNDYVDEEAIFINSEQILAEHGNVGHIIDTTQCGRSVKQFTVSGKEPPSDTNTRPTEAADSHSAQESVSGVVRRHTALENTEHTDAPYTFTRRFRKGCLGTEDSIARHVENVRECVADIGHVHASNINEGYKSEGQATGEHAQGDNTNTRRTAETHAIQGHTTADKAILGHAAAERAALGLTTAGITQTRHTSKGHTAVGPIILGHTHVGHITTGQTATGHMPAEPIAVGKTNMEHSSTGHKSNRHTHAGHTYIGQETTERTTHRGVHIGRKSTGPTNTGNTHAGHTDTEHMTHGHIHTGHTQSRHTFARLTLAGQAKMEHATQRNTSDEGKIVKHPNRGCRITENANADHTHMDNRMYTTVGQTTEGLIYVDHTSTDRTRTTADFTLSDLSRPTAIELADNDHATGKQNKILTDQLEPKTSAMISENSQKRSEFLNSQNTDSRSESRYTDTNLDLHKCLPLTFDAGAIDTDHPAIEDSKSSFVDEIETEDSKQKKACRIKVPRFTYNRVGINRSQLSVNRQKWARTSLAYKQVLSFEKETFRQAEKLRQKEKAPEFDNQLQSGWRERRMVWPWPNTQNHTTQTENTTSLVHVGIQTSPRLHAALKQSTHSLTASKYLIYPKILRDKVKQRDHVISRHRFFRRHSQNIVSIRSTESKFKTVRLLDEEQTTEVDMRMLGSGVLNSGESDPKYGAGSQCFPSNIAPLDHSQESTSLRRDQEYSTEIKLPQETSCLQRHHPSFDQRPRKDVGSNPLVQHEHNNNDRMETHSEIESKTELLEKTYPVKRVKETTIEREIHNDRHRIERMNISEVSSQIQTETRGNINHDGAQMHQLHVNAREKLTSSTGIPTRQAPIQQVTSEVNDDRRASDREASWWSSRADVETTDSSCTSSRLSELRKFCAIRPVWKNANIEEIDRRVRRALRLREELKQSGSSGGQARSLIASYFDASATENATKCLTATKGGISSKHTSDLDSTNRSTTELVVLEHVTSTDSARDDRLCQTMGHIPDVSGSDVSSESERTAHDEMTLESTATETDTRGGPSWWASKQVHSSRAATPSQIQERRSYEGDMQEVRVEHSLSFHEETISDLTCRPERASTARASSQPSNSNSWSSIKRAGTRIKNSPPTKISKVDNTATNTPRLVGALVQKLPQVPLTSFVEWFIETSDPNNFVSSDMSSSSSDNSQSNSVYCRIKKAPSCEDQESLILWPDAFYNESHEDERLFNHNKDKRSLRATPDRQTLLQEAKKRSRIEQHKSFVNKTKPKCQKLDKHSQEWKNINSKNFSATVATMPSSGAYETTNISGEIVETSTTEINAGEMNRQHTTPLVAGKKAGILKYPLKSTLDEKQSTKMVEEVCRKSIFDRKSDDSLSFDNGCLNYNNIQRHETARKSSSSSPRQHSDLIDDSTRSDTSNDFSLLQSTDVVPNTKRDIGGENSKRDPPTINTNCLAHSTHIISSRPETTVSENKQSCEMDDWNIYNLDIERPHDQISDSRTDRADENTMETKLRANSECLEGQYDPTQISVTKQDNEDNRCAPGIRNILMKLRQTKDTEDAIVTRSDRMKITLRKSSDVTGIIAKFQNKKQH